MELLLLTLTVSLNILLALFYGRVRFTRGIFPVATGILSLAVLDIASLLIYLSGEPLDPLRLSLIVTSSSELLLISSYGKSPQRGIYALLGVVTCFFVIVGAFAPLAPGAFAVSLFLPLLNLIGGLYKRPAFSSKPSGRKPCYVRIDDSNAEVLIILALLVITVSVAGPDWTGVASLSLSTVVFIFVAFRIYSGSSISIISRCGALQPGRPMEASAPKPLKSPDSSNNGKELFERCCKYMEEKRPYLLESFSMQDLARAMYTNVVYMSRTINAMNGTNFKKFVNTYRVGYAQELFRKDPNISLTELYHLSGFANSATFNNAFKAICDESPSSWCRRERMKILRKHAVK